MNISDKIQTSEYIYSTFTNWGLKKFICDVEYFTTEPLNDLFYVICSILNSNGGSYNKRSLGVLLGFCMCNQKMKRNTTLTLISQRLECLKISYLK